MIQINLLPWREHKRQQEKRAFFRRLSLGSVLALLTTLSINYYVLHLTNNQQIRNQMLRQELTVCEGKINELKILKKTRARLLSQISAIHHLLSKRMLIVHLFDELTWVVPTGIYLRKVEEKDNVISLFGYARSNIDVSWVLQNMEHNEWIQRPILHVVKQVDDQQQSVINGFKLTFTLGAKHSVGTQS
ncbi:MAG: PilN domain-containing protein [Legionella sp.]|uniref:PilN domain-containing protein n=1 Tax=Legionella sp. TaxID=459 RepID=UPI00284CEB69|nr:PilN domain-containing protein [Legionella sp.]